MTQPLDTHVSYLKINEETFKKTAKRLTSLFYDNSDIPNKITLSLMQENLAKSLGFRNTDAIINYFKKKEEALPATKMDNRFILNWTQNNPDNPEFLVNLILSLIEDNTDSTWQKMAIPLISAVMGALMHMSDNGEILLDSDTIREYLILDNVVKAYKTRRDYPSSIRAALRAYLMSIPTFQEAAHKQNETVYEQHGYLQMQFHHALHALKKLEKCDPLILNPAWFEAVYIRETETTYDGNEIITPKKKVKFSERLNSHNLNNLYSMFSNENLNNFFDNDQTLRNSQHDPLFYINNNHERIRLMGIVPIPAIANSVYAEDSWLADPFFLQILIGMFKSKQIKTLYLTDLLMYSFKIVNQKKRDLYLNCVHNLLKNYETVVEYSKEIHELAH